MDTMTPCFVDLDTQHDFLNPEGRLYIPQAERILDNLNTLTDFAVECGIPVISSASVYPDESCVPDGYAPHCIARSDGAAKVPETLTADYIHILNEDHEGTIMFETQLVLEKQGFSIFENANARQIFEAFPTKRCVVYGVPTELTVLATVRGLCETGYQVEVVRDAICALDAETEEAALSEMARCGATFVTIHALLQKLDHMRGDNQP